jgi:uncharacterized protein with von Willebrand factor type A (vWA) domain
MAHAPDLPREGSPRLNIKGFYHVARACLVKSEADFDAFDLVFARYFEGIEGAIQLPPELLEWLADPHPMEELSEELRRALEHLDIDELMRRFQATMAEQTERHDGGSRWIGTAGARPTATAASTRPASASAGPRGTAPR